MNLFGSGKGAKPVENPITSAGRSRVPGRDGEIEASTESSSACWTDTE